jgi:hypothetical protein
MVVGGGGAAGDEDDDDGGRGLDEMTFSWSTVPFSAFLSSERLVGFEFPDTK